MMPAPQTETIVMRTLICQWKFLECAENSRRYCIRIESLTKVMQAGYRNEPEYCVCISCKRLLRCKQPVVIESAEAYVRSRLSGRSGIINDPCDASEIASGPWYAATIHVKLCHAGARQRDAIVYSTDHSSRKLTFANVMSCSGVNKSMCFPRPLFSTTNWVSRMTMTSSVISTHARCLQCLCRACIQDQHR